MPVFAVGQVIEVSYVCRLDNQIGLNVRHYECLAVAVENTDWSTVWPDWALSAQLFYCQLLPNTAEFRGLLCRQPLVNPPPAAIPYPAISNGNNEFDALPGQVSGLIALKTDVGGRRYRGRAYLPFPPENLNDTLHVPEAAYLASAAALADALFVGTFVVGAEFNEVTLRSLIWHKDTATGTPISSAVARPYWATQQRRGSFGRTNVPPPV